MYLAPKVLSLVLKEKYLARLAFTTISQTGIQYRQRSLASGASFGDFARHAPQPGDRLPYIEFQEAGRRANFQERVSSPALHLFLFLTRQIDNDAQNIREVVKAYSGTIVTHTVVWTSATQPLFQAMGMEKGGCYLVRPDMFVAYRSTTFDSAHLERYLARLLITSTITKGVVEYSDGMPHIYSARITEDKPS